MKPTISDIKGIGVKTAEVLTGHGLSTLSLLADASIEKITNVPGFSESRAVAVKDAAKTLLNDITEAHSANDAETDSVEEQKSAPANPEKKDRKKNKGKKKDKKKGKKDK